jgi:hypothetical protein
MTFKEFGAGFLKVPDVRTGVLTAPIPHPARAETIDAIDPGTGLRR